MTDEAALLADIFAHPDQDEPRLVYADWLNDKGDPRGELIVLQCSKKTDEATEKRVARLLKTHGQAWLGPLASVLTDVEFRRGFVDKATLHADHIQLEPLAGLPDWATISKLTWLGQPYDNRVVRRVPRLQGMPAGFLVAVAEPWTSVEVGCWVEDLESFRTLLGSDKFVGLQRLEPQRRQGTFDDPSWLAGVTTCPARHMRLPIGYRRYQHDPGEISEWITSAAGLPVDTLTLLRADTEWRLTRVGGGWALRLHAPAVDDRLRAEVAALAPGLVCDFELTGAVDDALVASGKARVASLVVSAPAPGRPLLTSFGSLTAVGWSAEGWWAVDRGRVLLVSPTSGQILRTFAINPANCAAFTSDGKQVIIASGNQLYAYELATGTVCARATCQRSARALKTSRDGRFVVVSAEYEAILFDLVAGQLVRTQKAAIYYTSAISDDGARWAAPLQVRPSYQMNIYDHRPRSRAVKIAHDLRDPCFLADGRLVAASRNKELLVFDADGKESQTINNAPDYLLNLVPSPNGRQVAAFIHQDLGLFDLGQGRLAWSLPANVWAANLPYSSNSTPICFSPDGRMLLIGTPVPTVVECATGELRAAAT